MKKAIVAAIALVILGAVCSLGAWALADGDIDKLDVTNVRNATYAPAENETVTAVRVDTRDGRVRFVRGDAFRIEYRESDVYKFDAAYADGTVTLTGTRTDKRWLMIGLPLSAYDHAAVTVYVPDGIAAVTAVSRNGSIYAGDIAPGSLDLTTTNGDIRLEGVTADTISAETTNADIELTRCATDTLQCVTTNDDIELKDMQANTLAARTKNGSAELVNVTATDITVANDNGKIMLNNVSAGTISAQTDNAHIAFGDVTADTVKAVTDNGRVEVRALNAQEIRLVTDNASIHGTVSGRREDYRCDIVVNNGSSDIRPGGDGDRYLYAETANGNIRLEFLGA